MRSTEKHERNREIFNEYQAGTASDTLAYKYGVTGERIRQIVHKEASRLNVEPRGQTYRRTVLNQATIDKLRDGELTAAAAAEILKISRKIVRIAYRRQTGTICPIDRSYHEDIHRKFMEKMKPLYERFVAGEMIKDLAEEIGTTRLAMSSALLSYRRYAKIKHKDQRNRNGPRRSRRFIEKFALIYERLVAGETRKELAEELGITTDSFDQCVFRYRKHTGTSSRK